MTPKYKVTDELLQILATVAALKRQNIELTAREHRRADTDRQEYYNVQRAKEKAEEAEQEYKYAARIAEKHPDIEIEIEMGNYFELACLSNMGSCVNAIDCLPDNKILFFNQARRFFKLKKWLVEVNEIYAEYSNRYIGNQARRAYRIF